MNTNIVYNEDCIKTMRKMENESINMILTDPPYGIAYKFGRQARQKRIINDGFDEWKAAMPLWLAEFKRVLTPTGVACCFCAGGGKVPATSIFTLEAIKHLSLIQTLIWLKSVGLGWRYRPAYETIVVLSKSKDKYDFFDKTKKCSNVIAGINKIIPRRGDHPTMKPVKLMERLMLIHTRAGAVVYDPFAGHGATGVAAARLGRKVIMSELDPEYCDVARGRLARELDQKSLFY